MTKSVIAGLFFASMLGGLPAQAQTKEPPMPPEKSLKLSEIIAKIEKRDQFRYIIEKLTLASSGAQAAALLCIADGSDLVHPGAGPGGADVIIDDSFTSGRESWDMRLDPDGNWRAYDAPAVGPTEAADVCPAS